MLLLPAQPSRAHHSAGAFTLIEMMVVVLILAIMATMIVPRLTGNDKREFKLAVDQVADLLTMYAQRERLGQKVVGIGFDRFDNSIRLMVVDTETGGINEQDGWKADFYVKPVQLPKFIRDSDIEFAADGGRVDPSEWPIANELGQQRPQIEITLKGASEIAHLTLAPYAVAPVLDSTYGSSGVIRERLDLDRTGHSREDW